MAELNYAREEAGLPALKPCDLFDLIGGTSTGGLIAIMLGRLGMEVDECINAYTALIKNIFVERESRSGLGAKFNVKAKFSSEKLRESIESVLQSQGVPLNEVFNDGQTGKSRGCRVSYDLPGKAGPMNRPSIVQVALATSAAPSFFDEVNIDDIIHLDGGLGANNPVKQVAHEASDIWCREGGEPELQAHVKCFLSIGTGHPGINPVRIDNAFKFMLETLKKMATDTEKDAGEFAHSWKVPLRQDRYHRFNVQQGLQDVLLQEYNAKGKIESVTRSYLEEEANEQSKSKCVEALKDKENWILSVPKYRDWKNVGPGYFWLTGKIGSGKTFITTTVIEELLKVGFVGHYFFQPTAPARIQAGDLFRSYVLQIIAFLDDRKISYPMGVVSLITQYFGPKASTPAVHAIVKNILIPLSDVILRHGKPVFYVLDGLDACNPEEISSVLGLFRESIKCRIFISARDEIRNRID
ncbi:hypothetical protein N0V90_004097 [Kalmusia sp. IMI 367209]|nr:hypothetical protein N0V90_004097 [Kalmusia sp. IMI 367209]